MSDSMYVSLSFDRLLELVEQALIRAGMSDDNARAVARTVAASERDDVRSHGLLRLSGFVGAVRDGWADGRSIPSVEDCAASLLKVDARNGFAQTALAAARTMLVEKARKAGVAVLLIRNAHHFAALWPDVEPFADEGFVALTCVNSRPRMSVWGGRAPVIGTNASAFACPQAGRPSLVWDQSSSVMAQGELLVAARDGREVPPGVGFDAAGRPTNSPAAILEGGTLAPFGEAKGASIAVMVEILAAALTGSAFGIEEPSPPSPLSPSKCGQFLVLIDCAVPSTDAVRRADILCSAILEAGASRLPGQRRHEARRRSESEGIRITEVACATLLEMAGRS